MLKIELTVDPDLSKAELIELLQKIRDIEQNDPDRTFGVSIDTPDWSKEEVLEVLRSIEPGLPYEVVIAIGRGEKE